MGERVVLGSVLDMQLENAERVALDHAEVGFSAGAVSRIERGRERYLAYLQKGQEYVYGSTTAPGSRAKVTLSANDTKKQGGTLRTFMALQAGPGGEMLPERCVRLAIYSRLSNALTGHGKLSLATVQAVADLLRAVPQVPMQSAACSGEIIPMTWLLNPLADLPLGVGEAMALINGSPFATAMACDVALTIKRRVRLAEMVFALSIEAARCPLEHFDVRLGQFWPDPYYTQSLQRLQVLCAGMQWAPVDHQAPTSWRVLPNVLASALQATDEVSRAATLGLQSLKDNPTYLFDDDDAASDVVVSSSGYHDHRAARAIDGVNTILVDLCVLANKQVSRLLDGEGLGLPPLLTKAGDLVGLEYLAWASTEPLALARGAAAATTLDIALDDPAGNQSDVSSLAFVAYQKHRMAAHAFDRCLASLAITTALALDCREGPRQRGLRVFQEQLLGFARSASSRVNAVGAPMRQALEALRHSADDIPSAGFEKLAQP